MRRAITSLHHHKTTNRVNPIPEAVNVSQQVHTAVLQEFLVPQGSLGEFSRAQRYTELLLVTTNSDFLADRDKKLQMAESSSHRWYGFFIAGD